MSTRQLEENRDKLQQQIYDTNMYDSRFHNYREYIQYQKKHEDLLERFCAELRSREERETMVEKVEYDLEFVTDDNEMYQLILHDKEKNCLLFICSVELYLVILDSFNKGIVPNRILKLIDKYEQGILDVWLS